MGSYGPGHSEHFVQFWLGPATLTTWRAAVGALHGTLRDRGPMLFAPNDDARPTATFVEGWVCLPQGAVAALGRALVAAGGRPVHELMVETSVDLDEGGVSVGITRTMSTHGLDGARVQGQPWAEPASWHDSADIGTGDGYVRTEVLDWLLQEEAASFLDTLPESARVPALAALHPELAPRRIEVEVEAQSVSGSPSVVVDAGGTRFELPGGRVDQLLADLSALNQLDESGSAPNLDRWAARAARRAGLDGVPPEHPPSAARQRYDEVWAELTAPDRGRPGRSGAVAAWRWRTPGVWPIPPAEVAILAARPQLGAFTHALAEAEVASIEVAASPGFPPPPPPAAWPEVDAVVRGRALVLTLDGAPFGEVGRDDDDHLTWIVAAEHGNLGDEAIERAWAAARGRATPDRAR